jgi:cytochrome c biogenesis protein CcdA
MMELNGIIAFSSGVLSFFAPCVLPLIPSYLVFISRASFDHTEEFKTIKFKSNMLTHAIAFVLGFSFVFISLGISSSLIGEFLSTYQTYISRAGGILLIIMGLFSLNLIFKPGKDNSIEEKTSGHFWFLHCRYRLFPWLDTLYRPRIVFHINSCFNRRKCPERRTSVKYVFTGTCYSIYHISPSFRSTIRIS